MKRIALHAVLLLLSPALFAQLVIHSVTPSSGPTSGGTTVVIKGEFGTWPYYVYFGGVPALSTDRPDADTLVAVTPPHLPGNAPISVFEYDLIAGTTGSFEFTGGVPEDKLERILVPTLTPPVHGAFGSEFHTELRLSSSNPQLSFPFFGLEQPCLSPIPEPICPSDFANVPMHVRPGQDLGPHDFQYDGKPGRFLYLGKTDAEWLAANLRVFDVSRASLDYGTEIPVVRSRDFEQESILLLGVPTDPRFRNTLRIYGTGEMRMTITVQGRQPVELVLSQPADIFDPAYGVFTDFPVGSGPVWVRIDGPPPAAGPSPPIYFGSFWAFITVTNNETQVISTITPQP